MAHSSSFSLTCIFAFGIVSVIITTFIYQNSFLNYGRNDFHLMNLDRDMIDVSGKLNKLIANLDAPSYNIGPIMKLIFFHMRKTGGTHIDSTLNEFMLEYGCINKSERVGVRGIKAGVPLDMLRKRNYTTQMPCPRVDYIHEEMSCLESRLFLANPVRGERKDKEFAMLTILRDPIERIGSQAFYGSKSLGHSVIKELLLSSQHPSCSTYKNMTKRAFNDVNPTAVSNNCKNKSKPTQSAICVCFSDTFDRALGVIRVNESLWFDWTKNVLGYADSYMPNYYIRRLVRTTDYTKNVPKSLIMNFNRSIGCVSHNHVGCADKNYYSMMRDLFPVNACSKVTDQYNLTEALHVAKTILKEQFEIIITEKFSTPEALAILQSAFRNVIKPKMKEFFVTRDNGGIHSTAVSDPKSDSGGRRLRDTQRTRRLSSYRPDIPLSVLAFFEKDNAADIDLYKFAVAEFEERALSYQGTSGSSSSKPQ